MQQLAPKIQHRALCVWYGLNGAVYDGDRMVSGTLQQHMGYEHYFIFVMIATIPSFLITWYAPFHQQTSKRLSAVKKQLRLLFLSY